MIKEFLIGCCYYPEHWDEANMENDIMRIKDLGFNTVRMGEFSWSIFEKEEGCFDFSLLEKAVRLAEKNNLYVILGTPTAAPPRWLTERYPEVLCKNSDGIVMSHGSRQHHNHTSEVYLRFCARITEEMAKTFSRFKNVIGWQIDNIIPYFHELFYAIHQQTLLIVPFQQLRIPLLIFSRMTARHGPYKSAVLAYGEPNTSDCHWR